MNDARCDHLGAGDFLDLAGGTGAVIDLHALAQPQIDDVLLPRHLLGPGVGCERKQRQAAEQQNDNSVMCEVFVIGGAVSLSIFAVRDAYY